MSTSVAPSGAGPDGCVVDPRFPGIWKSRRTSQLGPATMNFVFRCDCTYETTTRVLAMGLRETGTYWFDNGRLSFSRASGKTTSWPFAFDGGRLLLEEHEDEVHVYEAEERWECVERGGPAPGRSGYHRRR